MLHNVLFICSNDICQLSIVSCHLTGSVCLSWKPRRVPLATEQGEKCWFWQAEYWVMCKKRSHMEYEWQPSVDTRSFSSHGQFHHPVMYTQAARSKQREQSPFLLFGFICGKANAGEHSSFPARPNTKSSVFHVFPALGSWQRAKARRLVCSSLKAICCLLTVAYRIAEWGKERVCASGSPSTPLLTSIMMS